MGLLDSILGAMSGKSDASDKVGPLIGVLSGLLTQSGGLQGLANKYSQSGQGNTFSSWVAKSTRWPQRWEWIPPKPRTFWPNTCQRLSTN